MLLRFTLNVPKVRFLTKTFSSTGDKFRLISPCGGFRHFSSTAFLLQRKPDGRGIDRYDSSDDFKKPRDQRYDEFGRPLDTKYDDRHRNHDNRHGYPNDEHEQGEEKKKGFKVLIIRVVRNIFLLTGGMMWLYIIYDKIMSNTIHLNFHALEEDEEVRLLALFDLDRDHITETGGTSTKEVIDGSYMKPEALHTAIQLLKQNRRLVHLLGSPVHVVGYTVAEKLNRMVQAASSGRVVDSGDKNKWKVECLLEGPKGLVSLNMEFTKEEETAEDVLAAWILTSVVVASLKREDGQPLMELKGTMPLGVNLK